MWQEDQTITEFEQAWGGTGTLLPVAFRLPHDVGESDDRNSNNEIIWRLQVDADVPGVDYHVQFEVPVFRTAESDQPVSPEVAQRWAEAESREAYRQPPGSRIRVTTAPRGTEIYFPPARHPLPALGLTLFTAVWTVIVLFLMRSGAPVIFPIVFGLFNVLMVYAVLHMWLGHSRVLVDRDLIRVRKGIAFITRTRSLPSQSLSDVAVDRGMQSGNTPYYDLTGRVINGDKINLARSIRDKREAEWLAETIRQAAGVSASG